MTAKSLKYAICIECCLGKEQKCPESPQQYSGDAYCFIHLDENHPNNFKPHACQTPERVHNEKHLSKKCPYFGLSFFQDRQKAIKLHGDMNKRTKNVFGQTNGTLLATVRISHRDGVYDEIDSKSHFNFFEFYDTNLFKNIKEREKI